MKKIEIIWREMLYQALEQGNRKFTQKDLAAKFGFSVSTVFQALKAPRKMGAVKVGGRQFRLIDPEKLLYHWASVRNLGSDIILEGRVDKPAMEIEGLVPPDTIFGGYRAAREILDESPADYDKIYVYAGDTQAIEKRFTFTKGPANFFVLRPDQFLIHYGQVTSLAQTFVDLWNLDDWYAKDFTKALKEEIDGLLP
jgi:hypothetical protein